MPNLSNLSRARFTIHTECITPKISIVQFLGNDRILTWDGHPIAVFNGVLWFCCDPGPEQRAVNDFVPDAPHIRADARQFDFIVGQVLVKAGLPLTMKEG